MLSARVGVCEAVMEFRGRKIVITGGGRRIGRELAGTFAALGARVVIHCRSSEAEAHTLLEEIGGAAAGHELAVCDLADPEELKAAAPALLTGASLLINNASMFRRNTIVEETPEEFARQMAVNFTAPALLMKWFAEYGARPGVIVNLLDQGIARPDGDSFSYALAKKALSEATRAAALQLAPEIRVNAVAPGPVLPPVELPGSRMEKTLRAVPLGRPVAMADLCAAVVFLASNESITGAVLFIDCGQSLSPLPVRE